jgi:hypothetical protein
MGKLSKVVGFGLVNEKSEYLFMEQVSNDGIEVYTREKADNATLFDTHEKAKEVGLDIFCETGQWKYMILDEDLPISIVAVTKIIEEEEIERLVY